MWKTFVTVVVLISLYFSAGAYFSTPQASSATPINGDHVEIFFGGVELAIGALSLLTVVLAVAAAVYFKWLSSAIRSSVHAEILNEVRNSQVREYIKQGYSYYDQFIKSKNTDAEGENLNQYIHLINIAIDLGRYAIEVVNKLPPEGKYNGIKLAALGNTAYYLIEHDLAFYKNADISERRDNPKEALEYANQMSAFLVEMEPNSYRSWFNHKESQLYVYWKTGIEKDLSRLKSEMNKILSNRSIDYEWKEKVSKKWGSVLESPDIQSNSFLDTLKRLFGD